MWVSYNSFLMVFDFYSLHLHNKICVALTKLQWSINKNHIPTRFSSKFVTIMRIACWFLNRVHRFFQLSWVGFLWGSMQWNRNYKYCAMAQQSLDLLKEEYTKIYLDLGSPHSRRCWFAFARICYNEFVANSSQITWHTKYDLNTNSSVKSTRNNSLGAAYYSWSWCWLNARLVCNSSLSTPFQSCLFSHMVKDK